MVERGAAWVSGGASGIGLAICRTLAGQGWRVCCADLRPGQAEMNEIVDVADAQAVEASLARAEAALGPLTAAVNNAGIMLRASLLESDPEAARGLIEVNLMGVIYGVLAQGRLMAGRGAGQIINVSSGHAAIGAVDRSVYAAAKAGVEAFTRNAAIELAPHGVRVNAVAPGYTFTEMSRGSLVGERLARVEARLPLGRVGEAEEAAEAVALLARGELPQLIGQTLRVDGGWTISDPPLA